MTRDDEHSFLSSHSAHDVGWLIGRWRDVAARAGRPLDVVCESGGYEVVGLKTAALASDPEGIYLCAGVHGDEPAGPLALLGWAEANPGLLADGAFLILPCFNPWGVENNVRSDRDGADLNRRFDDLAHPHIRAWREYVGTHRFSAALTLHEDYDARGCYLYEVAGGGEGEFGGALLDAVSPVIPPDRSAFIEGRPSRDGVVDTSERPTDLEGMPEALALADLGVPWVMTFETPSEFSLFDRVAVQRTVVDRVVDRGARARR